MNRTSLTSLAKAGLSSFSVLFLGVALGGGVVGVQSVGVPTPDLSPDARRLEDKVMNHSGNLFLAGALLSLLSVAGRFMIGRKVASKLATQP